MSDFASDAHVQNVANVFLEDILRTDRVKHGDRTLLDHLYGTARLLASWDEEKHVCYAGLFHSIYGTSQFRHVSVPMDGRHIVRNIIGERAEELAMLFCLADRSRFPWAVREAKALYTIEAANLIEQRERVDSVRPLLPWLEGKAKDATRLYCRS